MGHDFSGPLAGVRVIDLTSVFMGPSATQLLGDLGADVIKVEVMGGEPVRKIGPCGELGLGPLFLGLNRNKRSIELDLKQPEAREALLTLVRDADVFATNVRQAGIRRLGLDPEALLQVNPRLVYASMVGFSERGPYAGKAAFDDMIQAATGLSAVMGTFDGGEPSYVPFTVADRSVGIYAFGVISAALYARERTGVGQHVEIPMFETMIPYVLGDHLYGHTFVPPKAGFSYPRLMSANRRPYRTKDGHVCCLIYTDQQWTTFLKVVGKSHLMETDPRFRNIGTRTKAIDELYSLVSDELAQKTTAEWRELLPESDIPIFPMHTLDSLLQDEHLRATGFFREVEHPVVGPVLDMAVPSEWSGTVPRNQRPAPVLGQHTREILREAGMEEAQIGALLASGAARESTGG